MILLNESISAKTDLPFNENLLESTNRIDWLLCSRAFALILATSVSKDYTFLLSKFIPLAVSIAILKLNLFRFSNVIEPKLISYL